MKDENENMAARDTNGRSFLIFIFIVFSVCIMITGYFVFSKYDHEIKHKAEDELMSVGNLKIQEILHWRKERMRNLTVIQNEVFGERVKKTLLNPDNPQIQNELLNHFIKFKENYGYDRICLHDLEGKEFLRTSETEVDMPWPVSKYFDRIFGKKEIVFEDFYFDGKQNKIYLPMVSAQFDFKNSQAPLAVIISRIDPAEYLYPLLASWPVTRNTAETILIGKNNDRITALNGLKKKNNPGLSVSYDTVADSASAEVKAFKGFTGIIYGRDYNGDEAVSYVAAIPDSPWFLVAKLDNDEAFSPAKGILMGVGIVVSLLIIMLGAGIHYFYRMQRYRYFKEIARQAEELKISEENLRVTMASIGDGVIATDGSGYVSLMNKTAEKLTGWNLEEARGNEITQVFRLINAYTRKEVLNPIDIVMRDGRIVGLANHTVLLSKDGTEFQIADSAAPIVDDSGKNRGMILVFSDVTGKYAAEEKIAENERFLNSLISNLKGVVYRRENDKDKTLIYLSKECKELTGYYPEDLVFSTKLKYINIIHENDKETVKKAVEESLSTKEHFVVEYRIIDSDGKEKWVLEKGRGVFDESGELRFLEGFITDITATKTAELEIRAKSAELERSNRLMIDREKRMIDLKKEINSLLIASGKETKYEIIGDEQYDTGK